MNKKYLLLVFLFLTACAVGKDYVRPDIPQAKEFKEAGNWKKAEPKDELKKGNWWEIFADNDLNKLESQIDVSNQNVKIYQARYNQAKALVAESFSNYFPTISASGSSNRSITAGKAGNNYSASLDAAWELDLWGKVRRTVEANEASAAASKGDLEAIKLSMQASLATNYINLRIADEQQRLLDNTVENYKKSLQIATNLYNIGTSAKSDVLQAKTQLESAQAQATEIAANRAALEHAIAVLLGVAPSNFALAKVNSVPNLPTVPMTIPSEILERLPDVAAAERRVIAANAQIGVAKAAYFPTLSLSASGGYQSNSLANWFSLPNRIWSLGPNIAETLFDGGLRHAQVKYANAVYDETVANYRQTVLSDFQAVEDNLASLRVYEKEIVYTHQAVTDAQAAETIFTNQYKAGIVSYLSVITAQNTTLNNKLTELNIKKAQLSSSVALIKAIGGKW